VKIVGVTSSRALVPVALTGAFTKRRIALDCPVILSEKVTEREVISDSPEYSPVAITKLQPSLDPSRTPTSTRSVSVIEGVNEKDEAVKVAARSKSVRKKAENTRDSGTSGVIAVVAVAVVTPAGVTSSFSERVISEPLAAPVTANMAYPNLSTELENETTVLPAETSPAVAIFL
jgi:hypothetical protein